MNLNSDRLIMGEFERGDLDEWYSIESDPLVRKYIDGSIPTRKQTIRYIDMNIGSYARFNFGRYTCLLYTSPSPRDLSTSRMPSSA